MKTDKATTKKVLSLINVYYPKQVEITQEVINAWHMLLKDIDAEVVMAATVEVCADGDRFPPPCGVIRQRALKLESGVLIEETGAGAWDKIIEINRSRFDFGKSDYATDQEIGVWRGKLFRENLTDNGKKALKSIGGTWELNRTTNSGILRAQFINRFDELQAASKAERNVMPETKALLESRRSEPKRLGE